MPSLLPTPLPAGATSDDPRAGLETSAPDPVDLDPEIPATLYAGEPAAQFAQDFAQSVAEFQAAYEIAKSNFPAKFAELKSKLSSLLPGKGSFLDGLGDTLSKGSAAGVPWRKMLDGEYEIGAQAAGWLITVRLLADGTIGDVQLREERKSR